MRSVAAVIAGLVVAFLGSDALSTLAFKAFGPGLGMPTGTDRHAFFQTAPAALIVLTALVIGAAVGGYVAAAIGRHARARLALIVGVLVGAFHLVMLVPAGGGAPPLPHWALLAAGVLAPVAAYGAGKLRRPGPGETAVSRRQRAARSAGRP